MSEKSILLIIGGGVAAYKSLYLIRELRAHGIGVTPVLTRAGAEFITPLSAASLSGNKCYTDLFDLTDETEMGHIELSRAADLVVVAPATADLLGKVAGGLANDLASTTLLATDKPVLFAPAMNVRMWEHPSVQRNVRLLKDGGARFVGPDDGAMACGEFGPGRMAEPDEITAQIGVLLGGTSPGPLSGRHVLVTAGPTHEPLDPVRYLANRSSGKQGFAIAAALAKAGAEVTLVSGPVTLPDPSGVKTVRVETARQMLAAVEAALPADVAICAAAVADYRPEVETDQKIKKESGGMASIPLAENPDILHRLSNLKKGRPALVIGFAAETDNILDHAEAKRKRKGCDWIIANDVSPETGIMGGERNRVTVLSDQGREEWDEMSKMAVAERLATKIAAAL